MSERRKQLAESVLHAAKQCGWTVATAESCSAGAIAQALASAPRAAEHFHGGVVAYTKPMKHKLLGVPADLLRDQGAVCAEVAEAMAKGALARSPADATVAITGVAGPEPDEDGNPVRLIYCAVATKARRFARAASLATSADTIDGGK